MRIDSVVFRLGNDFVKISGPQDKFSDNEHITINKLPNGEIEITSSEGTVWLREWISCQVGEVSADIVISPKDGCRSRDRRADITFPKQFSAERKVPIAGLPMSGQARSLVFGEGDHGPGETRQMTPPLTEEEGLRLFLDRTEGEEPTNPLPTETRSREELAQEFPAAAKSKKGKAK